MAGYIGNKSSIVSSGAERKFKFTITETTTTLSNLAYTRDLVHVFHNGVRLVDGTDYTATNGTSITLTNAAENGDEVVVVSYGTFSPADTVSASAGGTFSGDVEVNGNLTVDTNTLFVDATNNRVGIGTSSPATALDVAGTVTADGLTVAGNTTVTGYILSNNGEILAGQDVGGFYYATGFGTGNTLPILFGDNNASIRFRAGNADRIKVDGATGDISFYEDTGTTPKFFWDASAESLGIGATDGQAPLYIQGAGLQIAPDVSASDYQGYTIDFSYAQTTGGISFNLSSPTAFLDLYAGGSSTNLGGWSGGIRFHTGGINQTGTERMRIDSSGNVGIGTSSPSAKLDVVGANDTTFDGVGTIRLSGTNAYNSGDAGSGITFAGIFDSSNGETTFAQISGKKANTTDGNYDGVLTFGVRNTLEGVNIERMRIDSSGNVGIGTTSPNALLAVNGGPVDYTSSASGTGLFHVSGGASSIYTAYIGVADDGVRFGHNGSSRDLIFDTNETERMRIDSAGRVTMPYQPAFYASVDYDNGGTVTNYGYTWLNRGSHFNATTGLFTAPVAGVYYFAATIMGANSASAVWWRFVVNGILTGSFNHSHSDSSEPYRTVSAAGAFQLSANDTVGIYLGLNTAYSSGPNPWSSFSGFLIG